MFRNADNRFEGFRLAAEVGEPEAQYQLGLCYATGRGVEQDYTSAHMWLNLAALRGSGEARHHRSDLATEMLPSEIVRAQRQAREWMKTH